MFLTPCKRGKGNKLYDPCLSGWRIDMQPCIVDSLFYGWLPHRQYLEESKWIIEQTGVSPPGCGAGHGRYRSSPCPCWGVIASPIPFLSIPDISFPPIYWGGGWRTQNRNTHLGPCCSFPVLFIFCLFLFLFIYLFIYYQTEVLPPTVYPRDHHQACSFQMPQPPCLFQVTLPFHFLSWLCCFNNVDLSLG